MKIDLQKTTLSTAVLVTFYAIFRIVQKCCMWSGIHFWLHHPIRGHIVGRGIDMLFDLCIAVLLLAIWANRNQMPKLSDKWKHVRNILVFALGYLLIFQIQITCHYPLWCSRIFFYTLWLIPIVYVAALWMFYVQTKTAETYALSNPREALVLWTAILLLVSVAVGIVLVVLWYDNTTEWLDRWHWRIPLIISAIAKLLFILFLTIKNK